MAERSIPEAELMGVYKRESCDLLATARHFGRDPNQLRTRIIASLDSRPVLVDQHGFDYPAERKRGRQKLSDVDFMSALGLTEVAETVVEPELLDTLAN